MPAAKIAIEPSLCERERTMLKLIFACASVVWLATVAPAAAAPASTEDCEARMQKLDASNAEGEERLAAKNDVIAFCTRQYARDETIKRLVKACAKYEEQPVVKQQAVAECQLAAFNYANALRTLKAEYKK
jgi:hypothetical protein